MDFLSIGPLEVIVVVVVALIVLGPQKNARGRTKSR